MEKDVFIIADNLTTPLGTTTAVNFGQLQKGISGVKQHQSPAISTQPFAAAMFEEGAFVTDERHTRFEKMLMASITDALAQSGLNPADGRIIFILSTTKGNIDLLHNAEITDDLKQSIALHHSASVIAEHFHFSNKPVVISSACISGLSAIVTGARMIRQGLYDYAVIAGADLVSRFVVNGFQSFQALSAEQCRPFDKDRTGINLGEGAATIVLSAESKSPDDIKVTGGSTSDDANHISGPSRTGEELGTAINAALKEAGITPEEINMISAHGTATIYNDEMEAQAITYAGLNQVPLNSLKGFYGHTLGAAGLIESVITVHSMQHNLIIPTPGFNGAGTTPVNVVKQLTHVPVKHALKTASGFGGCNAAVVFSKQ